jgi:hypothetical protein
MTHYEVLGVAPTAPTSEVRRAYVTLARRHHPDLDGGDAEEMRAINDAWATLRDPARRASYDRTIGRWPATPVAAADPPPWDLDDRLADLEDDTLIGGVVVLPRWYALLPVAVFAASVVALVGAMLFNAEAGLALAASLFVLSVVMFLVAPFVALLASRRGR